MTGGSESWRTMMKPMQMRMRDMLVRIMRQHTPCTQRPARRHASEYLSKLIKSTWLGWANIADVLDVWIMTGNYSLPIWYILLHSLPIITSNECFAIGIVKRMKIHKVYINANSTWKLKNFHSQQYSLVRNLLHPACLNSSDKKQKLILRLNLWHKRHWRRNRQKSEQKSYIRVSRCSYKEIDMSTS
jgi:hypothetical protein